MSHPRAHAATGIFLHILADTLGSVGVIFSSLLIHWFQWYRADAICSIMISVLIVLSVIPLLKASCKILLQVTPTGTGYSCSSHPAASERRL